MRNVRIPDGPSVTITSGPTTESGRRQILMHVYSDDGVQPNEAFFVALGDQADAITGFVRCDQGPECLTIQTALRDDAAVSAFIGTLHDYVLHWASVLSERQRGNMGLVMRKGRSRV